MKYPRTYPSEYPALYAMKFSCWILADSLTGRTDGGSGEDQGLLGGMAGELLNGARAGWVLKKGAIRSGAAEGVGGSGSGARPGKAGASPPTPVSLVAHLSFSIPPPRARPLVSLVLAERKNKCALFRSSNPFNSQFKEFITRLEGGERTQIPEQVINKLLHQCSIHRINPKAEPDRLTYSVVRQFLQTTGFSRFFENIPKIMHLLTGVEPHKFTREQKKLLINIFLEVQPSFEKNRGRRKNFLSYSYVTYKICELLGLPQFLTRLPLLKAPKNLLAADNIWRSVCKDLKYEFIPTT